MKILLRFLSFAAAAWSILTHIHLKPTPIMLFVGWIKIGAGSITPLLAFTSGLYTLLGWRRRDGWVVLAGLVGALVSLRHIAHVTAPHDAFERAFGPYWRGDIPMRLRHKLRPRRFTPGPFAPSDHFFQRDLIIGTNTESGAPIRADLWTPPPNVEATGLGIIYLHGSGWHYLDKDMGTRPFFSYLAGQGHTILDVAYTLAPQSQIPGMVGDVKQAIAWFKEQGPELGVNPRRIVLWGASAGGQLALLAAYAPDNAATNGAVRGVISYYGITDLVSAQEKLAGLPALATEQQRSFTTIARQIRMLPPEGEFVDTADLIPGAVGGTLAEVPERYMSGSPINYVGSHCPPTLLINGAHDFGVDITQHSRLHGALVAAGVAAAHVELPLTEHAFDLFFPEINPAGQAALYDLERFLALMV
jgi:acetyl esterase/lipase